MEHLLDCELMALLKFWSAAYPMTEKRAERIIEIATALKALQPKAAK